MKCGGFNKTEITDEHINIINNKKDEIEKILISKGRNGKIEYFEISELQQQVVSGINYLFKIKLQKNGDEHVQVKIYKNLNNETIIHSIKSE